MNIKDRLSGNEAVSIAIKQIVPDVVAAFPITPSTEIPQYISEYIAKGKLNTEFVTVESEHSAMSACIGAEAAGARSMSATSSCGLALMYEMLYVAASSRLPINLACINRALTGPININNDHSDSMGARDSGWLQIYAEDAQEAYDNFIQGVMISEDKRVQLPIMTCQDGFITSHAVENLELLDDETVKNFVGDYKPEKYLLNKDEKLSVGPYDIVNYYLEHKILQAEAMANAKQVILEVAEKFEKISGRKYSFFESYKMEDAERAMVIIGSSAGTSKEAVDELRAQGEKVGLIKLRVFRPFPATEIAKALKGVKAVAIMDKCEGFSANGGPLGVEVKAALCDEEVKIKAVNVLYGIGGRDYKIDDAKKVFEMLNGDNLPRFTHIGYRSKESK